MKFVIVKDLKNMNIEDVISEKVLQGRLKHLRFQPVHEDGANRECLCHTAVQLVTQFITWN